MNNTCEPNENIVIYIFPLQNTLGYVIIYILCLVAMVVIGAYSYQLYVMLSKVNEVMHEQIPLVVTDDDKVGKETAYRNTKLTGVTEGCDGGGGAAGGAGGGGTLHGGTTATTVGGVTNKEKGDSNREQITKIEEKMAPEGPPRKLEKPKSVGLNKVNSGPRSVFLG